MEELVQQIIEFLVKRESSQLVLSCQETVDWQQRGITDYLHYKKLILKEADVFFLQRLAEKDASDPKVAWLFQGLSYDCHLEVHLAVSDLRLIPKELCYASGIDLYTNRGRRIIPWCKRVITYKDVVQLPNHCVLLKNQQVMTMLAQEKLLEKEIEVIERERSLPI